MNCRLCLIAISIASCAAIAGRSAAQVVQLPTIRTFQVQTSVRVPDRGTARLGGSAMSSAASTSRGGVGRRGFGRSSGAVIGHGRQAAGSNVTATVIDLDAMDRQIRGVTNGQPDPKDRRKREVERAKQLVRYARKMRDHGNDATAKLAYSMAVEKLDGYLYRYAAAEFRRYYPETADTARR